MFSILGPTLGGYLSRPEENFPELSKRYPLLRDVPVCLSNLTGSIAIIFRALLPS